MHESLHKGPIVGHVCSGVQLSCVLGYKSPPLHLPYCQTEAIIVSITSVLCSQTDKHSPTSLFKTLKVFSFIPHLLCVKDVFFPKA